jgi:predicted nucleotidyltransferase
MRPDLKSSPQILQILRELEAELHGLGVRHLSLFGSAARGELTPASDIDLAVDLQPGAAPDGFAFVGYVDELRSRLGKALGREVDLVVLPARRGALQKALDRDAIAVF